VAAGAVIAFVRDDAFAWDEIVCGRKMTLKGSDSTGGCKRNQFTRVSRIASRQWNSTTASNTVGRNLSSNRRQYKGQSLHAVSPVHGQARTRPVPVSYRWSQQRANNPDAGRPAERMYFWIVAMRLLHGANFSLRRVSRLRVSKAGDRSSRRNSSALRETIIVIFSRSCRCPSENERVDLAWFRPRMSVRYTSPGWSSG